MKYAFDRDLFTTKNGNRMIFYLKNGRGNSYISDYIQRGGGEISDNPEGPHSIVIGTCDEPTKDCDVAVFDPKFIFTSCKRNSLANLADFRINKSKLCKSFNPNHILEQRITWSDAKKLYSANKNLSGDTESPNGHASSSAESTTSTDDNSASVDGESENNRGIKAQRNISCTSSGFIIFDKQVPVVCLERLLDSEKATKSLIANKPSIDVPLNIPPIVEVASSSDARLPDSEKAIKSLIHNKPSIDVQLKIPPVVEVASSSDEDSLSVSSIGAMGTNYDLKKKKKNFRQPYARYEQESIVTYLHHRKAYDRVGGNVIWKEMERKEVCKSRTWESMKEQFRKKILPNIHTFNLPPIIVQCFKEKKIKPVTREVQSGDESIKSGITFLDQDRREKRQQDEGEEVRLSESDIDEAAVLQPMKRKRKLMRLSPTAQWATPSDEKGRVSLSPSNLPKLSSRQQFLKEKKPTNAKQGQLQPISENETNLAERTAFLGALHLMPGTSITRSPLKVRILRSRKVLESSASPELSSRQGESRFAASSGSPKQRNTSASPDDSEGSSSEQHIPTTSSQVTGEPNQFVPWSQFTPEEIVITGASDESEEGSEVNEKVTCSEEKEKETQNQQEQKSDHDRTSSQSHILKKRQTNELHEEEIETNHSKTTSETSIDNVKNGSVIAVAFLDDDDWSEDGLHWRGPVVRLRKRPKVEASALEGLCPGEENENTNEVVPGTDVCESTHIGNDHSHQRSHKETDEACCNVDSDAETWDMHQGSQKVLINSRSELVEQWLESASGIKKTEQFPSMRVDSKQLDEQVSECEENILCKNTTIDDDGCYANYNVMNNMTHLASDSILLPTASQARLILDSPEVNTALNSVHLRKQGASHQTVGSRFLKFFENMEHSSSQPTSQNIVNYSSLQKHVAVQTLSPEANPQNVIPSSVSKNHVEVQTDPVRFWDDLVSAESTPRYSTPRNIFCSGAVSENPLPPSLRSSPTRPVTRSSPCSVNLSSSSSSPLVRSPVRPDIDGLASKTNSPYRTRTSLRGVRSPPSARRLPF